MSKHIKRLSQPRRWKLPRKVSKWAPTTSPGPHGRRESLPLEIAVRDELRLADRAREARRVINEGHIHVDGAVCRDPRRGVGLFDVVSVPAMDAHYRVVFDTLGRIALLSIEAREAGTKLARIENKTTVKKGRTQLNLFGGRNLLVKEDTYKTGDVVRLKLPGGEIAEHFPFKEGAPVYITGGRHIGQLATLVSAQTTASSGENIVRLKAGGEEFDTIGSYAFVVGKDKPVLKLEEVKLDA